MPPRPASFTEAGTIGLRVLAAFLALAAVAVRLSFLSKPFAHDAGVFIYLGKMTGEGGRFCHDVIDNKLPTVGLLTSVLWRAFGPHWTCYVLTQLSLGLIAPLLLARLAGRHIRPAAAPAVGLFAVVFFNFDLLAFSGFQLETIESFFAILAAGAALEALADDSAADSFVAGLAAAVAAMAKPTGLAVLAAFGVAMTISAIIRPSAPAILRLTRHALAALAGAVIPLAVCIAYLYAADILADMPALFRQIARYGAETPWAWPEMIKPLIFLILVGFPFLVRAVIFRRSKTIAPISRDSVGSAPRTLPSFFPFAAPDVPSGNSPSTRADTMNPSLPLFALLWFGFEALGIFLQRRAYAYHFLVLIPPAALLFGLIPRPARPSRLPIQLAAALLPAAVLSLLLALPGLAAIPATPPRLALSGYLAAHTLPGDAVWQDEFPRLLIETNLRPGARMPLTFLYLNYDAAPLDFCRQFLADLRDRAPKYVVLPTDIEAKIQMETTLDPPLVRSPTRAKNYAAAWRAMRQFVSQNYEPETVIGKETVYRRNDAATMELSTAESLLGPQE